MTEDEAYRRLRTLLVEVDAESVVLGQTCEPLGDILRSHQKGPAPIGAYGRITPLGSRDSGEGHTLCYEDITFKGQPRVVEVRTEGVAYGFRVDIYASRAADYARAFKTALLSARAQLELRPLVVSEVGEIKASAEREQEEWEGRAHFAVTLTVARQQRTLIDVIESGHIDIATHAGRATPIITPIDYAKE